VGVPVLLRLGIVRRLRDSYLMDRLRYGVFPKAVVVNAKAIAHTLRETPWMRSLPIHVISNGVDSPGPRPSKELVKVRAELGVGQESLLVLGVGRLTDVKRWDWLINSAARLKKQGISASVVILGEGDQRERLEAHIHENGLEGTVLLPGYTSDTDRWLSVADIFALPSQNEGLANAMLEAMGRGVPCVVTASGGLHEHFLNGRELLVAETDNTEEFSDKLLELASNEELRSRLGASGLESVRTQFSWEAMTEKLLGVLESQELQR